MTDDEPPEAPAQPDPVDEEPSRSAPSRRRRPFGLLVLAALLLFKAAVVALVAASAFVVPDQIAQLLGGGGALAEAEGRVAGALLLAIAAILVVAAIGLLAMRRSGWLLTMVLTGVLIALDIGAIVDGTANHFWMALNIVTVFYLNQADVRAVFGTGGDPEPPAAMAGPG
jgi:hypothetical protein